jgi:hypothetical protein
MYMRIFFLICLSTNLYALTLNRVILATDANANYIEFWPVVARAWKEIVGITPTLFLVASEDVAVDETLGEVIRFEPIEGIPTALQAQAIRLLGPALFPNDVCIISDIDMIPLTRSYFVDSIVDCPDDSFVIYRNEGFGYSAEWVMCYVAGRGSTYGEIFHVSTMEEIRTMLQHLYDLQLGWHTDEITMVKSVKEWADFETRCIMLGHSANNPEGRLNRSDWIIDHDLLTRGFYIDAHCPRPYTKHKDSIDTIIRLNRSIDNCVERAVN